MAGTEGLGIGLGFGAARGEVAGGKEPDAEDDGVGRDALALF